jgi:DNA polymerase-3 subunit beta
VELEVESPGKALLPARLLVDILRMVDGERVLLEQDAAAGTMVVGSERARFQLRQLPVEDFPRLPELGEGGIQMPGDTFAATVERVARAASRDETRPVLTGILVSLAESELRMVATDSYRLSVKETPLPGAAVEPFEMNIPARTLQEAARLVRETSAESVSLVATDNQVVMGIGGVVLSSRLIDGQFPNYRQLLPDSYDHEIRVSKTELSAVVRRVGLMAQRNTPLRLAFGAGTLTVSAQTPDVGEASEPLPVNYQGGDLEIGFNAQFLQDGLESVESEDLILRLISPVRPGLIEAEGDPSDGKFLYLIMPVRLNV